MHALLEFLAAPAPSPAPFDWGSRVTAALVLFLLALWMRVSSVRARTAKRFWASVIWGVLSLLALASSMAVISSFGIIRTLLGSTEQVGKQSSGDVTLGDVTLSTGQILMVVAAVLGIAFLAARTLKATIIIGIIFGLFFLAASEYSPLAAAVLELFNDFIEFVARLFRSILSAVSNG